MLDLYTKILSPGTIISFVDKYIITKDSANNTTWWLNGKMHREDGPAVVNARGDCWWFLNGLLHRKDGPAVDYKHGYRSWYINGQLHREDGPAVEFANNKLDMWYLNGQRMTKKEFKERTKCM